MLKFILASSSKRRIEILSKIGLKFKVVPHNYKEPEIKNHPLPKNFVKKLAIYKAKSLAEKYKNFTIISADTIVVLKNEIIGKPSNEKEAYQILKKLSGTKHYVYTGVCLYYPIKNILLSSVEKSTVFTNKLEERQLKKLSKKHLDKAGAYAVQQKNDRFVKKIQGDYFNVVGFPVGLFLELYKKLILKLYGKLN